ncbi:hypothetical protein RF11_03401 [Thelohanellus kitauei]|uniref:Uncharacterized protein n=1 Tax=Thelohanellus kitauei TaxID=669202 RepID=A0A0C2MCG6_THEKT|nr:hypothetical protein RF11_03401 [Thelohanellus kitauei]
MNKRTIENYKKDTKSPDLSTQIDAVRNFISHFSTQNDSKDDQFFIQYFPLELYQQFIQICNFGVIVDRYQEIQMLFIEVFTFIFRHKNFVMDCMTQSFVLLFTLFIHTSKNCSETVPEALFDSIINCVSYHQNKILFINKDAMFKFRLFFNIEDIEITEKYLNMCESVYNFVGDIRYLSCIKLTEGVEYLIVQCLYSNIGYYIRILIIVFRMLLQNRILDDISFIMNNFYKITVSILSHDYTVYQEAMIINSLSKIWTGIYTRSQKRFIIDKMEKLTTLCTVFAIHLSNKLHKAFQYGYNFQFTRNNKMKLYIIYLTIIAYYPIEHVLNHSLNKVLTKLHLSFQMYFEKYSTEDLSIEDQLHFFQYYIKSYSITCLSLSSRDDEAIKNFLKKIITNPLLSNIL